MQDAVAFCEWLSEKENAVYRLPTHAEWEYACRAGGSTEYYWGDKKIDQFAWYKSNSGGRTHPVGRKLPNGFGLYDMSGNVAEWCSVSRLMWFTRGGSWNDEPEHWRCFYPHRINPDEANHWTGFRVVCEGATGEPAQ